MKVKVSAAEFRSTASTLNAEAGNLKDILDNVKNDLLKIGNEDVFSGDAASALNAEFTTLSSKFGEFEEAVKSCATYLNGVADNYDKFESTIKSGIGSN